MTVVRILLATALLVAAVLAAEYQCGSVNATFVSSSSNPTATFHGVGNITCDFCAIADVKKVRTLVIEGGVISIGELAFASCDSLASVTISDTVVEIGERAFGGKGLLYINVSSENPVFSSENNVLYDKLKTKLILYHCGMTLEEESVIEGVTTIGSYAFAYCGGFSKLILPDSVSSVETGAFANCTRLTEIEYTGTGLRFENGFLMNNDGSVLSYYLATEDDAVIEIPASVRTVLDYAFYKNGKIMSVGLNQVESLGSYAFYGCTKLQIVDFGAVQSIGSYAFYNCYNLQGEIQIPNSVTSLGPYAFAKCRGITSVKIGNGVTFIENYTFSEATQLTTVQIGESVEHVAPLAFDSCNALQYEEYGNGLYLGSFSNSHLFLYKAKDNTVTSCTVHSQTKVISESSFKGVSSLISLSVSDSVKTIEKFAFQQTGIQTLSLGNGVETIDDSAFQSINLTQAKLVIPNSVKRIGVSAFYIHPYSTVSSLEIGNGVLSIGSHGFSCFRNIQELNIPDSVEEIGDYAFADALSLETINIGTGLRTLGDYPFNNQQRLTSITVKSGSPYLRVIDNVLYDKDATKLYFCVPTKTSVNIEETVTYIATGSFKYCKNMTRIRIPKSVTSIGGYVFPQESTIQAYTVDSENPVYAAKYGVLMNKNGTLLYVPKGRATITVPDSVTEIPANAFQYAVATSVFVGDNVHYIGDYALSYMSLLEEVSVGSGVLVFGAKSFVRLPKLTKFCYFGTEYVSATNIFDGTTNKLNVTVTPEYTAKSFCGRTVVQAEECHVAAEIADSGDSGESGGHSDHSDHSEYPDISGTSNFDGGVSVTPSNWVIAVTAWFASTVFFLFF